MNTEKEFIEITEYDGAGYKPLVYFEGWRAALLNYDAEKYTRETMNKLERHNKTDELFVLLEGEGTLVIGKGGKDAGETELVKMEQGKLYNVKRGVWHNLIGSRNMKLFIVENADTSKDNTDYIPFDNDTLPSDI